MSSDDLLLPARMLNEFTYCPRLFYLEWVQQEWRENADTVEGSWRHRRVDEPRRQHKARRASGHGDQEEPERRRGRGRGAARYQAQEEAPVVQQTDVLLSAPREGLVARLDLMESGAGLSIPVDFKKGRVPDVPQGAWEPERVQLCAQGLVLRENGHHAPYGEIYFVGSRRRVRVLFDAHLVERTRELTQQALACARRAEMPPPLQDSPRCNRCSLASICLPDEVHHLQRAQGGQEAPLKELRRMVPSRVPRLPLYVQEQAARVSKRGDVLEISHQGEALGQARLREISHVALHGHVSITAQALRHLCQEGIPITHSSYGGWFYGVTQGHSHKNIERRLRQFEAAREPERCLHLARSFVHAKIRNARVFLRRNSSSLPPRLLDELKASSYRALEAGSLEQLLGIEGQAARLYFQHFGTMLKVRGFPFQGRNRRPPRDPVNALLSLTYGLLVSELTVAATAVGFDPYLGFFHQPRYGRPALALDMMEELRAVVADSVTLTVINNGSVLPQNFIEREGGVYLDKEGRRAVLRAYERRLQTSVKHPTLGYEVTYRQLLELQLRLLDRHLMGELEHYPAYQIR